MSPPSTQVDIALGSGLGTTIQALNAAVSKIARTDIPVLLFGESGTGKEFYARLIHRLSGLGEGALKKTNCRALDAERLLSQLQQKRSIGTEEPAETLFLDGVDELDLGCQRGLLSSLPEGEQNCTARLCNPRLISSSTKELEKEVAAGRFRRELFFRLSGVCLRLPPLRERKEDIPLLIEYFLAKYSNELRRKAPLLNSKTILLLTSYTWPGNMRELEHAAKSMVALADSMITPEDLLARSIAAPEPPEPIGNGGLSSLKAAARAASRRAERELILQALERTNWNRKRAARDLQVSYKSLLNKIKQIGVQACHDAYK